MRQLDVYVNDVKAGMLTELNPGKGYTFVYTEAYLDSDLPPVSLTLPKRKEAYEAEFLFPFFGGIRGRVFIPVFHKLTPRRS